MNVDVKKKVLNRKLRKRRRVKPAAQEEPSAKLTKTEREESDDENQNVPEQIDSDQEEAVEQQAPTENESASVQSAIKSSILTNTKFDVLKGNVSDRTLDKLGEMGFQFMTEIQSKAIEPALAVNLIEFELVDFYVLGRRHFGHSKNW